MRINFVCYTENPLVILAAYTVSRPDNIKVIQR